MCVQLLKYNLTILVLVSTQSTHPALGRYASRVRAPLLKNSESALEYDLFGSEVDIFLL